MGKKVQLTFMTALIITHPLISIPNLFSLANRYESLGMEGEGSMGSGSHPERGNHIKQVQLKTRVTTSTTKKVRGVSNWRLC